MERQKALAVAAMGSLLTASAVVSGASGMLRGSSPAAATSDSGVVATTQAPVPAPTPLEPVVVTETRDVFDRILVATTAPAVATVSVASAPAESASKSHDDEDSDEGPAADSTTSTTAPTTSTTRPPGVPDDWPDDRPIPPMPEDCEKPQLEDNGTWNCDH